MHSDWFNEQAWRWSCGICSTVSTIALALCDIISALIAEKLQSGVPGAGRRSSKWSKPTLLLSNLLAVDFMMPYAVVKPFVATFLVGISSSLSAAANWASIQHLFGARQLGITYEIFSVIGNIAQALEPLVVGGLLTSSPPDDHVAMTFFVLHSAVAFGMILGIVRWNCKNG
ncbi:hypothetical protein BDK51DRAFT_42393 [Blyttiomyces helicus]|uniref:Major facilitator superfamily domain-containing protein n=1 Tax=Blyttiomyces helicus TaxID=388810 RepID=A0A4P9WJ38_9FUNG|nr:hypothetical protein BDK51DRAFT_42393 [Blyttiomyces helicus]|eukprot:RKO91488.1 hypothetical protein BDK51DRAFT_42393 [Blyttiomyces helicus]